MRMLFAAHIRTTTNIAASATSGRNEDSFIGSGVGWVAAGES